MLTLEPISIDEWRKGIDYLLDRYNRGELVIRKDPLTGSRVFMKRILNEMEGYVAWSQDDDDGWYDFVINERLP